MTQKVFTFDDLMETLGADTNKVAILRFSSVTCVRCPAAKKKLEELEERFAFLHVYVDAHHEDSSELVELYEIKSLPALVFIPKEDPKNASKIEGALPDAIRDHVALHCPPKLQLDADF